MIDTKARVHVRVNKFIASHRVDKGISCGTECERLEINII